MLKHYPKTFEDAGRYRDISELASSTYGSLDALSNKMRAFFREYYQETWLHHVRYTWLERRFVSRGRRRVSRAGESSYDSVIYSQFMRFTVGHTQQPISQNFISRVLNSYLPQFYPDFDLHDPFKEVDYYKFPYQNIGLGHMCLVYQMHNRLELLEYAEKNKMPFGEFYNWAINWALSYNEDQNKQLYEVSALRTRWIIIKATKKFTPFKFNDYETTS